MSVKLNKEDVQSVSGYLFLISFILLFSTFLYNTLSKSYQLTSDSFAEMNKINTEIIKLSPLQNTKYKDKEKLLFEMNKLFDSNIFYLYYSSDEYIIEKDYISEYYPDYEKLKKTKVSDIDISNLMKVKFFKYDSLTFKIDSIFKTMQLEEMYTSDYVNNDSYYLYSIKTISEFVINNSVLERIKTIKDDSFSSIEDFKQKLREILGIEVYKKYSDIIIETLDTTPSWVSFIIKIFGSISLTCFIFVAIIDILISKEKKKKSENDLEIKITKAEEKISNEPKKATPIWDLANLTLQKYYDKNLSQVNSIYRLSIAVMTMGFLLIVSILIATVYYDVNVKYDSIGIIAGIITEFIGATFLFIYKSTIKQAMQYSKSLEEINKVGMSIKILEAIEMTDNNKDKLDDAKIDIAKILIVSKK